MADEQATLLEQETEEEVTTTEEESDDSETESQETEEESTESEEPVQEFDNEEDFVESEGLGRKSLSQVFADYKKLQQEAEILRQHRAETGFQPPQQIQSQSQQDTAHKFLPNKGLAKKHIESLRFNNDDSGKRARESYEAMSSVVDSVLDPVIEKTEEGIQTVLQGLGALVRHLQKQSYDSSPHKNLVKFEDIQPLMLKAFELDSNKAIRNFIVNNRPDLLSQLQQKAEQEGQRRGQRKLLKKFSTARRQKQATQTGVDWRPFFTNGEPNEKFHSQKTADRLKIAEAYQKAAQREYEGR